LNCGWGAGLESKAECLLAGRVADQAGCGLGQRVVQDYFATTSMGTVMVLGGMHCVWSQAW